MPAFDETRTLRDLSPGQSGIILSVGNESGAVKRRLIDMGLTPGTEISVRKIAPFGDPIEVNLRGYALSLRKSDAAQIAVGDTFPQRPRASHHIAYPSRRELDPRTVELMRREHEHERLLHPQHYDARAHDTRGMSIALAGNPNSGKTTLFNALTGSSQYVGNWPGVTVEKKEGSAKIDNRDVTIVDLPGIYSLSPYSMEEIVTRDYIIGSDGGTPPDAIINIVDATNLERNMYLTVQLLELEKPMVMALNFMDEARRAGDEIDVRRLSEEIGIPVVPITAKTGENLQELLYTAHRQMHIGYTIEPDDLYDDFTHEIHHRMGSLIHDRAYAAGLPAHWASIKLLEGDQIIEKALGFDQAISKKVEEIARTYEASSALGDRETLVADSRYAYIRKVVTASVKRGEGRDALSMSARIDKAVTHRVFAVPIFLLMMLVMFLITFGPLGSFLTHGVGYLITDLKNVVSYALTSIEVAPWLTSLVCDGVIAGVGGVVTFLPQIALLFVCLSILEDSGYMARAAFIMDRLLRHFGLSGKAFIPMIMGFGCSVPAVMGARTMENEHDRRMTILLIPFMSCSAKLPVYAMIASAFFGAWAGVAIFSLYLLGMGLGILSGILFKKTLFTNAQAPFIMELPPYRLPSFHNTLLHVWEKVRGFLLRAGTLILIMSIVIWFLESFDSSIRLVSDSADSLLAAVGSFIAPLFRPMGFGMWQAAVALLTGLVAKEAVVASMSMFYGFALTASGAVIAAALVGFTPLSAFAFLVFILLYVPCVATVSTIYKETGSLKWTGFSIAWQIAVAYVVSFLVYTIGLVLGL